MNWFEVDKEGLAKLLERRGKQFAVFELVQNCWDQAQASLVTVSLTPVPNLPLAKLIVEDDDPQGFANLSHAFTLFAESTKKGNPEQRGRFNLGEKLVLALCEEAEIASTTGTVVFDRDGRHPHPRRKRAQGSQFSGLIRMTRAELEEVCLAVRSLIPPTGKRTVFNGEEMVQRTPLHQFIATLPTVFADADGVLRHTKRQTTVSVYEVLPDERASLYELGIPVVETELPWNLDVAQKIPLNTDRDNVTPAFLRGVQVFALNAMRDRLTAEEASAEWVSEALAHPDISDEAVHAVVTQRFGERRVSFDPSDREANDLATCAGYTVIPGGSFSAEAWKHLRRAQAVLPAGQVTPSPRRLYGPDGEPEHIVPPEKYSKGMKLTVEYARELGGLLLGAAIKVRVVSDPQTTHRAWFSKELRSLTFNVGRLGYKWFAQGVSDEVNALLIHEFGHFDEENHLSDKYHKALCSLGAQLARLALTQPAFFERFATSSVTARLPRANEAIDTDCEVMEQT